MEHGQAKRGQLTRVYVTWTAMKQRCYNPNKQGYERYGGRGITVCDEWRNDFNAFYSYVGEPPSPKHSLDRIDNDKGYEPGNVRWATKSEQILNSTRGVQVTYNGMTMNLKRWAEYLGLTYPAVFQRYKAGMALDDVFGPPKARQPNELYTYKGKSMTLIEWSKKLKLDYSTVCKRARNNLPLEADKSRRKQ